MATSYGRWLPKFKNNKRIGSTGAMDEALAPGQHQTVINDLRITYHVYTDKPGLPVVCLHPPAWGIGCMPYLKPFSRLASKYTLVIPEPRGNDTSERPSDPLKMSTRDSVSDLEELRKHLGVSSFSALMGHSAGGKIVQGYAMEYPDRVAKLVLLSSDLQGYERKDKTFNNEIMGYLMAHPPKTDMDFKDVVNATSYLYFKHPERGGREAFAKEWTAVPSLWAQMANQQAEAAASWRQIDELYKIKATTLVMSADGDLPCGPEVAEAIAARVEGAKLVILEDCGHFGWMEQNKKFWEVVDNFLAEKV